MKKGTVTVHDAAFLLGVSKPTLKRAIAAGELHAVKQTRYVVVRSAKLAYRRQRWLILWSDIEAWWATKTHLGPTAGQRRRPVDNPQHRPP